ncbi:MAG: AAA family ATPase [Chloroflexi bacterium]|nr:AAA family ATPase [Chloroflexota bacterium]
MLSIRLLGAPELLLDGRSLAISRRKSRALIYYLAAQQKPVKRERLLAFFWPDADRASAQQTLRATLYGLRKALGDALAIDDEQVGIAAGTTVDTHDFEAALQSPGADTAALSDAVALYRGEFLADFGLPDTPEFDDWVAAERERYRRLMVRGLTALSRRHEQAQDYAGALAVLDRALAFDPLQEDVQRAALRLHYYAGDRAGAIRRYEQFRRLLDDEMGVPPMAETRALYDAIITDKLPQPAATPAVAAPRAPRIAISGLLPFTGRALELEALRRLTVTHKVALIEGEAGIGKSRLIDELIATSGWLPVVGRARELEGALPYQPVIEALRDLTVRPDWPALRERIRLAPIWCDEVAHLLPELSASHRWANVVSAPVTINDESRLWEGVSQFLLALAQERPLVFTLDDAHWADASSLALVGYLARRVAAIHMPVALIIATRPIEARSPLAVLRQALVRDGQAEPLHLRRLTADDTVELARHLSRDYAQPLAHWLARTSEGNPYILSELVREARERQILRPDGVVNLTELSQAPPVPRSVYSLIESRLARLSDNARRVVDVGVAVGREFEFDIVARAAGLSEAAVLDAVDELRSAHLIGEAHDADGRASYLFDHSLTMEVAYAEVGEARHRLLHRRVAEAIEQVHRQQPDAVAGLLAWHYAEGGEPERAAPHAFRAGQLAARLPAWKEAIAFYEQAARSERDPERSRRIYIAMGEACYQSGAVAKAIDAYRRALSLARGPDADDARIALARALMTLGQFAETIALAQAVLDSDTPDKRADAEFTLGTALSVEGADLAGAIEHLQRAASMAPPGGILQARVRFEMGSIEAQLGNLERAIELYRASLDAVTSADPSDEESMLWRIFAHNNLAYHLHLLSDPRAAEFALDGLRMAQERGMLTLMMFLLSTLGEIALAAGDLDQAETRFTEGLALAEQSAVPERIAGLTANLGRVAQARGQSGLAIHRLSTALARAEALGLQHLGAQIHIWLAPLLPPAEGRAHVAAARAIAESGRRKRLLTEVEVLEKTLA